MNRFFFAALALVVPLATPAAAQTAAPAKTQSFAPMQKFVIIFRQGPFDLTDELKAKRQAAIATWAKAQNAAGHKLEPRSIASESARPGLVAPEGASGAWPVSALVFLEAHSLADAEAVAAAHPAKNFNVSTEVRPWSTPAVSLATTCADGGFDVKMTPVSAPDAAVGRFTLDKTYYGDLEATSQGEMIAVMTAVKGSAGYTAIERVTGKLAGKSGTFSLQHNATMNRGAPNLSIAVIPDSGTGELTGLTGAMKIEIGADGSHGYIFQYALP